MTDIAEEPRTVVATKSAHLGNMSRIRKRYRAEARFRWYGIGAIIFASVFLVFLLGDILFKGVPAFTSTSLNIEVPVDADKVDPAAISDGNFNSIVNSALRAYFPSVTSRSDRRALPKLLSLSASDQVRAAVEADPALIGQTAQLELKLSDDADLFYLGHVTDEVQLPTSGTLAVSETDGSFTLKSDADDFAKALATVKAALADRSERQSLELGKLSNVLERLKAELPSAQAALQEAGGESAPADHPARARMTKLESDLASVTAAVNRLETEVSELNRRASDLTAVEVLSDELPSYFIKMGDSGTLKLTEIGPRTAKGEAFMATEMASVLAPPQWNLIKLTQPAADRRLSDKEIVWLMSLRDKGLVETNFNSLFFKRGDSREAEVAGLLGGMIGSALVLFVTLMLSLPIGVAAAIYLEEFAPKNRLTQIIEVNINNLAAVPSIVFGLLGLAVFLNFFGLPRSSAVVGGMVLSLMTLPTIIIASRAAIRAVPPSIREGALGVGASKQQAVFHHVLPLAMPGIFTGTIIGMAQALGETAPLLMIGMVAFIVDVPGSFTDAATVLPVQIYLWSDLPEAAFQAKTAGAIMVLLGFLFIMNALAVVLRRRFERRW